MLSAISNIGRLKDETQIPERRMLFQVLGHLLSGPGEYK